jgi:RNA polymerase sigma factor (sigma-70 family)
MASPYSLITDNELVGLLNKEDEAAFSEIYNRYWRKLYNHCYKRLKNKDQCIDVVQDVFADLWIKRSTKNIENLGAYLFTSIRYQVLMIFKKDKNITYMVEAIENMVISPTGTDTYYFEKEIRECITTWLEVQPAKRKEVFRLKFVEDKSSREISQILNVSQKTVKNQFTTSINALRVHLSKLLTLLILM